MWILIAAVATASLLGSMHCVGMCGPLAMWASGAGDVQPKSRLMAATALYHSGRLTTYAAVGWLAGVAGGFADLGGAALGMQLAAAKLVGAAMIVIGGIRLWQLLPRSTKHRPGSLLRPRPSWITQQLVRLRPWVVRLPAPARGWAIGLLTALLPCGWLYLFALVAAGTGGGLAGMLVMIAFWLGTVPLLVGLVAGTRILPIGFRPALPAVVSIMLIAAGGYTAAGRGFAQLNSLADIARLTRSPAVTIPLEGAPPQPTNFQPTKSQATRAAQLTAELDELVRTPLPCCAAESPSHRFNPADGPVPSSAVGGGQP